MTHEDERPLIYRRRAKVVTAYRLGDTHEAMWGAQVWLYEYGVQSVIDPTTGWLRIFTGPDERSCYAQPGSFVVKDGASITRVDAETFNRDYEHHAFTSADERNPQ